MTTYRLRDRKLQQKLDELSKGTFSELIATSGAIFAREDKSLLKLGNGRFIVVLHKEDFEAIYNPDAWNNYPEVTPPEGIPLRIQISRGHALIRFFAYYKDSRFYDAEGRLIHIDKRDDVQFKSWE